MEPRKPKHHLALPLGRTVAYALVRGIATGAGTLAVQILWSWLSTR